MKKYFFISIFFSLFFSSYLYAENQLPGTGAGVSFKDSLEYLFPLYPAEENSKNEKALFKYIKKVLSGSEIKYEEASLDSMNDRHSFSKNIYADIRGISNSTLILAFPVGGNSGWANISAALELIQKYSKQTPELSLKFIFLGAESGDSDRYPVGSAIFLQNFYNTENSFLLYFDLSDIPEMMKLQTGCSREITPYWLLSGCLKALENSGLRYDLRPEQNILYNIGMVPEASPADLYIKAKIPSIMFYNDASAPQTIFSVEYKEKAFQWFNSFSSFVETFISSNGGGFKEEEDKHYLTLRTAGGYKIIPETYIILFFLMIAGTIIFYMIFHLKLTKFYMKQIFANFYIIPGTTVLISVLFSISTYIITGFLKITDLGSQWYKTAVFIFILKLLITFLLFMLLIPLLKKFRYYKLKNFYTASAIFTAITNLIIFIIIDFSFSIFFIWSLICIFAFAVFKNKFIKFLCMSLSWTFLFITIRGILFYPAVDLCHMLIFSPFYVNLLISILLLPFLFMAIKIFYIIPPLWKMKYNLYNYAGFAAIVFLAAIFAWHIYSYDPYDENNKQIVDLNKIYDIDSETSIIAMNSDCGINEDDFFSSSSERYPASISGKLSVPVDISAETEYFLKRKNITVNISAEEKIDKIYLSAKSSEEGNKLLIMDSNYPYESKEEKIIFHIGKNQPMPFSLEITTPQNSDFSIDIVMVCSDFPFDFEFSEEKRKEYRKNLILKKRLSFPWEDRYKQKI